MKPKTSFEERSSRRPPPALWSWLRHSARSLHRRPGTPIAIVVLLALGLATAATTLTVVDVYLLRALPFPAPDRIHSVLWETSEGESAPDAVDPSLWTRPSTGAVAATAWDLDAFTLLDGPAEIVLGAWVTPGFFDVAGLTLPLGRAFTSEEVARGERSPVVISHELWQRRFGGRPDVLGRQLRAFVSDRPEEPEQLTVVGVLPEGFWWVNSYTHVLAPLREGPVPRIVRLAPFASADQTATAFADLSRAADPSLPASFRVRLEPLRERYTARVAPLLRGLILATCFVLLVACGNSLLLLLVRTARRERELAVHATLAGGWSRAGRLLAGEAVIVCFTATAGALALAAATLRALRPHLEQQLGRTPPGGAQAVELGTTTLVATGSLTLLAVLLFSLLPIWLLRRRDLASVLRGAASTGSAHRGARRLRATVLAAEIAFTLALLAAGGLAVRSAVDLERRPLGHARSGVLTAGIGLRLASYPGPSQQNAFAERLLERVRGEPGVERAAIAAGVTLAEMSPRTAIAEAGSAEAPRRATTGTRSISNDYFATLGIALRDGRDFAPSDHADSPPVAIVSQELAETLWPNGSALGNRLRLETPDDGGMVMEADGRAGDDGWRTVVGVVAAVNETVTGEALPELYVPFAQSPSRWIALAAASNGDPLRLAPTLSAAVAELDPTLPLYRPVSIEQRLADERAPSRFLAALLGGFSLFALLLGVAGVYGVISHAVAQRGHEIAIRRSLGADRTNIQRLFLSETATLLAVGLAAGVGAGSALAHSIEGRLHGVGSGDVSTWLTVGALLAASALLATWIPARRAARVDPARLLRTD